MTARLFYRDNDGTITEFTALVHDPLELSAKADEGMAAGSTIKVRDPEGVFAVRAHRKIYVTDTECHTRSLWTGYTGRRRVKRGDPWVGKARAFELEVYDVNTVLDRRIGEGNDWNRPAESDVERVQWVMATNEASLIEDSIYISTDDPVQMSKCDYRGQSVKSVIDDCTQQSGKDFWAQNIDSGGDPNLGDFNDYTLWYGKADLEEYTCDLRLTNDEADVDGTTTFIIGAEPVDEVSGDRTYSGIRGNYDGGHVYVQRQSTAEAFARRDRIQQMDNVKTASAATARANRILSDIATEEHAITCTVILSGSDVERVFEGMRIEAKFIHLDEFADSYSWFRIVQRTLRQLTPGVWELELVLVPPVTPAPAAPLGGILRQSAGPFPAEGNLVYWDFVGDNPNAGFPLEPTTGMIEALEDGSPPDALRPFYGWKVTGTGTVDVEFFATTVGVLVDDIEYLITYAICLNGIVVASETTGASGFLEFWTDEKLVSVSALAVVPDDEITATIVCTPPTMPFFRTPAATGQVGERLRITGGSLS